MCLVNSYGSHLVNSSSYRILSTSKYHPVINSLGAFLSKILYIVIQQKLIHACGVPGTVLGPSEIARIKTKASFAGELPFY